MILNTLCYCNQFDYHYAKFHAAVCFKNHFSYGIHVNYRVRRLELKSNPGSTASKAAPLFSANSHVVEDLLF